jgi:hypothetical protein
VSPVLSVVHATHETKELREDPKTRRVAEYACKEKPRNAVGARDFGPTYIGIRVLFTVSARRL